MKKKIVLMSVAGMLATTAVIGGTLAGFQAQSEQGKTDITTKALGIDLVGKSVPLDKQTLVADKYLPGSEVEMPYFVTNDVEEGYDLYTRVTIYKYWEDKDNADLQSERISLYAKDSAGNAVKLVANGEVVQVNNWFVQYSDEEQVILYYAKPLASGETTGNVLDFLVVDERVDNAYVDQNVILEIQADAVQKIAAESSIPSEWGVYPQFDENGNIVAIAE